MNLTKWLFYHFTAKKIQILVDLDNLTIIVGIFNILQYNDKIITGSLSIVTTEGRAF